MPTDDAPANRARHVDHRRALQIARDTWARAEDPRELVKAATAMGLRLVVVDREGQAWEPGDDPDPW